MTKHFVLCILVFGCSEITNDEHQCLDNIQHVNKRTLCLKAGGNNMNSIHICIEYANICDYKILNTWHDYIRGMGLTSSLCDLDVDDDNFYEVKGVVIESLMPTYLWSLGEPNLKLLNEKLSVVLSIVWDKVRTWKSRTDTNAFTNNNEHNYLCSECRIPHRATTWSVKLSPPDFICNTGNQWSARCV